MEQQYSNEVLLEMYRNLKRGRIFTLKMHECVYKGLIRSSFHTPYGQEAVGVGVVSAMKKTDWLGFTHRLQCGLIMRYGLKEFIAELFALRDGVRHGSAYDYHLSDYAPDGHRILTILGTLGGTVPLNTGFAWVKKHKGIKEVSVIVTGDGTCSEGVTFEGWNIAALHKVPAVFVIDNNQWAMTVPQKHETANPNVGEKAAACGLPYQIADGCDVLAVRRAMEDALEKARNNIPNVVEFKSLRWDAHFVGQGDDYRHDRELVEESKKNNDCVKRYETYLMGLGLIDQVYIDKLTAELEAEIDAAVEEAAKSERPRFEDIYRKEYIYASPETGGEL